jgi:NADPH:quinone reductase-like Zn-dependent oxidoreductase
MRAVAVPRFRAPPELMELRVPTASPSEMLVRVGFAGINPLDWKVSEGFYDGSRPHVFPLILGVDGAGTVEFAGTDIARFRVGDRIFGQFLHSPVGTGTYTEFTTVPEGIGVARVPDGMTMENASALPTAGMTALSCLDALALGTGSSLVIVGASGGVGSFATEIAASQGIKVTAVARSSSAARLRSLGAEEVIDASSEDERASVAAVHPSGVDGLLDVKSDRAGFTSWMSVVRHGGAAVITTHSADPEALARAGLRGGNVDLDPTAELLERLARAVMDRGLRVPLERQIRLGDAAQALADLKAGRGSGKTVIDVSS